MKEFIQKVGKDSLLLTNMFDFIKDLVFIMKPDNDSFRYIYLNESASNVVNPQESIIGASIENVMAKERAEVLTKKYKESYITKKPIQFIDLFDNEFGQVVGETSLNPIISEDGECLYILAIVRDITERVRKEEELKETKRKLEQNQERLHSLVQYNSDAVFEFDLEGNFIMMNDMTSKITGYSKEYLIGCNFDVLITENFLESTTRHFLSSLAGNNEEYETQIFHKDGSLVHLLVSNVPIIVDGVLVGVYGIAKDITLQTRLHGLLEESEQRYKSLFDNHPDGIFTYDLEGNLTSGNAGVEKLTGYSMNDLLGKSFVHMMATDDIEKTNYYFNKTIQEKKSHKYEVAIIHKEGHRVELSVVSVPIIVEGQVVGAYGLTKDITNELLLKKELQKKNEDLETFWNSSVDPMFSVDNKGVIQRINPAFEEVFGYKKHELEGTNNLLVPDDLIYDPFNIKQRILSGETIDLHSTKRVTKDKKILDILASYIPIFDNLGKVIGATAFYKNVTELIRTEMELQKSEAKYKIITDHAFDVIHIINTNGYIEYVSPSNESILGYSPESIIGMPYRKFVHPDDFSTIIHQLSKLVSQKDSITAEVRVLHQNGTYVWMEVGATPVLEEEKVQQVIVIARDITDRKKIRDDLEKLAFYDFLSGLPNRRLFDKQLEKAIQQANHSGKMVAVMMLDGHKFKQINDTYGHDAGDSVIKEMAIRLKNSIRETDTVARLGGDEMGIILPELDTLSDAETIANRIVKSFKDPLHYNNQEIKIGAGIGIAIYPNHSIYKKVLIKSADLALYEAKKSEETEYRIYE